MTHAFWLSAYPWFDDGLLRFFGDENLRVWGDQGRRTVRLGGLKERKKRPHLVENRISKSLKERFK